MWVRQEKNEMITIRKEIKKEGEEAGLGEVGWLVGVGSIWGGGDVSLGAEMKAYTLVW